MTAKSRNSWKKLNTDPFGRLGLVDQDLFSKERLMLEDLDDNDLTSFNGPVDLVLLLSPRSFVRFLPRTD